jgi:hypothetical protein
MSIELIERVDELAVAYLASISYTDYRQECVNDYNFFQQLQNKQTGATATGPNPWYEEGVRS